MLCKNRVKAACGARHEGTVIYVGFVIAEKYHRTGDNVARFQFNVASLRVALVGKVRMGNISFIKWARSDKGSPARIFSRLIGQLYSVALRTKELAVCLTQKA